MTDEVAGVENDGLEFGGLRNEGLKIFEFCKCQSPFACNCNAVITHIASFTFSCKDRLPSCIVSLMTNLILFYVNCI